MAEIFWPNAEILIEQDTIMVDDLQEARARFLDVFARTWDEERTEVTFPETGARSSRVQEDAPTALCHLCGRTVPQRAAQELPHLSTGFFDYYACADCAAREES
jgi:hypothetical protein